MAKKVVATLKTGTGKNFTKCIKMVKSDKPVLTCSRKASSPTTKSKNSSRRRNKYFKSDLKYKGHPTGCPLCVSEETRKRDHRPVRAVGARSDRESCIKGNAPSASAQNQLWERPLVIR